MLDIKYNHEKVENLKYDFWMSNNYFKSGDLSKKPFCIVLPPPNVTGKLHLGHAWDVTLQDIIIRYKRMQGYDCLWLPGMDHAAIATEAKVVKKLKDEGKEKYDITREEFLQECYKWTYEHANIIRKQWGVLGISLDYSKERFTLDDGMKDAVNKVFVDYYNKGLIYRGEKLINWDPVAKTALSNEEVIYSEEKSAFYHIKYVIDGTDDFIDVATTRPETLFGDMAVAVNPNDERYKKYVGKMVLLPLTNRKIPIIIDMHADMEKGTGAVKITPASDPNDYEVSLRHNLEKLVIMNDDATMNSNCFEYEGLTREECRLRVVKDLEKLGLLIKTVDIVHEVGHSERTGAIIEPMIKKQWFVKMRPLADKVLENQKNDATKVHFFPESYEKIMNHWMDITYDWCISRQLYWGHRIPAWYKEDKVYVSSVPPKEDGWVQDNDVLDTWFSSALWPFATLGYPNNTELLKRYYPNNCLVTGYDIIPFWVNRMTFQGLEILGKRPFNDCIIHGLIRDKQGRKFSKSLGNGIDPFDMVEKYGADALRYYLATDVSNGIDIKFDEEKMLSSWNYINKIWNASRFVLLKLDGFKKDDFDITNLDDVSKWILTKLNMTIKDVISYMEKYEFNNAAASIYSFVWDDFCSNYIELSKVFDNNTTKSILYLVLLNVIKLLHPFMPFVTEEIYQNLPIKDALSIMIMDYPTYNKDEVFTDSYKLVNQVLNDVVAIRNLKACNNISKNAHVLIKADDRIINIYKTLLRIDNSNIVSDSIDTKKYNYNSNYINITYFEEANDVDVNSIKLEIEKLKVSIERREKLLSNENYVNKAPQNIVMLDKEKLEAEKEKLKRLEDMIK